MKKRATFTIETDILENLKALSEKTMIPQSKIVELAIKEKIDNIKDVSIKTIE